MASGGNQNPDLEQDAIPTRLPCPGTPTCISTQKQRILDEEVFRRNPRHPCNQDGGPLERMDLCPLVIFYAAADYNLLKNVIAWLEGILDQENLSECTISLYDDSNFPPDDVAKISDIFERAIRVFVLLTPNFCTNRTLKFLSEQGISETRLNNDPKNSRLGHIIGSQKKFCIRPIHTEPRENRSYRVPPGLGAVHGIDYHNRDIHFQYVRRQVVEIAKESIRMYKERGDALTAAVTGTDDVYDQFLQQYPGTPSPSSVSTRPHGSHVLYLSCQSPTASREYLEENRTPNRQQNSDSFTPSPICTSASNINSFIPPFSAHDREQYPSPVLFGSQPLNRIPENSHTDSRSPVPPSDELEQNPDVSSSVQESVETNRTTDLPSVVEPRENSSVACTEQSANTTNLQSQNSAITDQDNETSRHSSPLIAMASQPNADETSAPSTQRDGSPSSLEQDAAAETMTKMHHDETIKDCQGNFSFDEETKDIPNGQWPEEAQVKGDEEIQESRTVGFTKGDVHVNKVVTKISTASNVDVKTEKVYKDKFQVKGQETDVRENVMDYFGPAKASVARCADVNQSTTKCAATSMSGFPDQAKEHVPKSASEPVEVHIHKHYHHHQDSKSKKNERTINIAACNVVQIGENNQIITDGVEQDLSEAEFTSNFEENQENGQQEEEESHSCSPGSTWNNLSMRSTTDDCLPKQFDQTSESDDDNFESEENRETGVQNGHSTVDPDNLPSGYDDNEIKEEGLFGTGNLMSNNTHDSFGNFDGKDAFLDQKLNYAAKDLGDELEDYKSGPMIPASGEICDEGKIDDSKAMPPQNQTSPPAIPECSIKEENSALKSRSMCHMMAVETLKFRGGGFVNRKVEKNASYADLLAYGHRKEDSGSATRGEDGDEEEID